MIEQFHFFCDESGVTQDSFLVISGIVVPATRLSQIDTGIGSYRRLFGMGAELKWCKITNQRERHYRAFIDYFFKLNRGGVMDFHSLIVPFGRFDHRSINHGDRSLSLHKMFYQLILHRFCRLYGGDRNELIVHPDLSSSPLRVSDVRR